MVLTSPNKVIGQDDRVILVIVFVINVLGNPAINIFVTLIVTVFLIILSLGQGGVYKQTPQTVLETSYIVNLGLLAATTALVGQIDGEQRPAVIYTSNTIALVTFIGTLVYHVKIQVLKSYTQWKKQRITQKNGTTYKAYERLEDSVVRSREYDGKNLKQVTSTIIEGID